MNPQNVSKPSRLFIGRYQPVHAGHKYLFSTKINEGFPVIVAVRKMKPDAKNPLNYRQVIRRIEKDPDCREWIKAGMMQVIAIPDISAVCYGRDVGYKIEMIEVPEFIKEISATKIRAAQGIKQSRFAGINFTLPIYKTITYRIFGSFASAAIGYMATGQAKVGLAVGAFDLLVKPIIYYVHEIVWQRFS